MGNSQRKHFGKACRKDINYDISRIAISIEWSLSSSIGPQEHDDDVNFGPKVSPVPLLLFLLFLLPRRRPLSPLILFS